MRALLLRDTWCVLLLRAWVAHGVVMYLGRVMADAVDGVVTFNINQEKSLRVITGAFDAQLGILGS